MPNNIAVAVTADVADLQVKRAILSAELKAATKDLTDFARTANASGSTTALQQGMLGAADAAQKARNQIALIDREIKGLGGGTAGVGALAAGTKEATVAMEGLHVGSAGVTRELIVLGREAARGNFSRMAGSATILAQRMGLLEAVLSPVGLGLAAVALVTGGVVYAAIRGAAEVRQFNNAMRATNGFAALTSSAFQEMSRHIADDTQSGVGKARATLTQLIGTGRFTGDTLRLIADDATIMGRLTGEGTDKMLGEFEQMKDGVAKFAQEYTDHYHQLTASQFNHIAALEREGRQEEAQYEAAKDVYDYLGATAPEKLGVLEKAWRGITGAIGGAWEALKGFGRDATPTEHIAAIQQQLAALQAQHGTRYAGEHVDQDSMQGQLQGQLKHWQEAQAAEEKAAEARQHSATINTQAIDAEATLREKYEESRSSGEKLKKSVDDLNQARSRAIAGLDQNLASGKISKGDHDAQAAEINKEADADIAQARQSDTPKEKKPKQGPDEVSEWREQLQAQTIQSRDFFADQTQEELKFWESKVALTKQGSKEWLSVQTEIYNAQKSLAHQDYSARVASLNAGLEADRDSWSKEQADWNTKLAYIASVQGKQSAAYQDAYKQFEGAEREHQHAMAQIAREGEAQALEELKTGVAAERTIREQNARTAESQINEKGKYSPGGDVTAAAQTMALHQRLSEQQMADTRAVYAQEDALREAAVTRALSTYGQDSQQYAAALATKRKADADFYSQQRVMQNQSVNQQLQDFQRIQQAWHSYVDPMVTSTGTQIKGLLMGTESWNQAIINIGEEGLNLVIQTIERMAEQWIVGMVTGQAAQSTVAMAQVASYAGIAGAAGVASMAGAPFPLDLSAPEFGASMSAAALAFGSLGAFAQGTNVVPHDMVAQIHAGERIIPAADNRQLMAALGAHGGANGVRGGGGGSGGATAMRALHSQMGDNTSALRSVSRQVGRALRSTGR
ncbi:MAG: phage tail length tape measure family protein [Caulobacteraceae bacterium]